MSKLRFEELERLWSTSIGELEHDLQFPDEESEIFPDMTFLPTGGTILEQEDSLHLIDPGDNAKQTILWLIYQVKTHQKPLRCVLLTHLYEEDQDFLEDLVRLREINSEMFNPRILGHSQNDEPCARFPFLSILQDEEFLKLDDRNYFICQTPGHSERGDHLAILEMKHKVLFLGTLLQPQGESYEYCTFLTPVSSHANPEKLHLSLENLKTLPFEYGVTENGAVLDRSRTYRWMEITQKTFERTAFYARQESWENDSHSLREKAVSVFKNICMERNMCLETALSRLESEEGTPDFDLFDRPGIEFYLKKFGGTD